MFQSKIKGLIVSSIIASIGLSACVVSDNPYTNAAATTAAIGVASMLFYSLSDGYYYDQSYNRMPRNYRPAANVHVQRINSIDEYRQQHPQPQFQRNQQRGYDQMQPMNNQRRGNEGRGRYQGYGNSYDYQRGYGHRY